MAKSTGDLITHCNSVRARIIGEGFLVTTLVNDIGDTELLANGTLSNTSGRSVTQLANFRAERIAYEIRIVNENEWFKVSNQYAYVKKTAASYPQL